MIDKVEKYLERKGLSYEIYYKSNNSLSAEVANDKIDYVSEGETGSLSVRVALGKRVGLAYTSNLNHYKNCVDAAVKVAKSNKEDNNFSGFVMPAKYDKFMPDNALLKLTPEDFRTFVHKFSSELKNINPNIKVSLGMLNKSVTTTMIMNSNGVKAKTTIADNVFAGEIMFKDKGKLVNMEIEMGDNKALNPRLGKDYAQRLVAMSNKKQIKTAQMPIIMDVEALSCLFSQAYVFGVSGENITLKKSLLKTGAKVFDEKITIVDDATNPKLFASRPFDSEGTKSRKFKVVDKGVFVQPLYNEYYARINNTTSTGNAYRTPTTSPTIMPNNIIIKKGKSDVLKETKKAIFVRSVLGTHTMNEVTGDFSLGVMEGYMVENGEVKHALSDIMIAGNFFDMMKDVGEVDKKLEHSLNVSGGCYFPRILFNKIKVVGK